MSTKPSPRARALVLFAPLATAKVCALPMAAPATVTGWLALCADDALLALSFGLLAGAVPAFVRVLLHGLVVAYAAFNAMVVHAAGTPLVLPMLRGVDPAMGDSAGGALTTAACGSAILVVAAALAAPALVRRVAPRLRHALAWMLVVSAGAALLPHESHPAWRNALVALARSALPRTWATDSAPAGDPRAPRPAALEPGLAELPGSSRGRSVVVVVLESAAARFLRPYGAAADPMPFVTSCAARGVLCTAAWAVYPESIKGQLALWHGTAPAPDTTPEQHARVPVPGLAALLVAHGYASGLFHAGRFRFLGMEAIVGAAGFATLADAATIGGDHASSFGVDEESTVRALLRWVEGLPPAQPFLAAYLPIAGHHPYASPPGGPFPTDHVLGCYRNALHYADRAVRVLWEGLCQRRPSNSLLLCIVGDHGQAFGEHDGNFGHTFALYEENLHVPLLFLAPGAPGAGARCVRPVSHLDVAPTLLDLLALPACAKHQGASILRPWSRLVFAFTDWGEALAAVRDGDRKFVFDLGAGTAQAFDLGRDPRECCDLAPGRAAQAARYRRLAAAWVGANQTAVRAW